LGHVQQRAYSERQASKAFGLSRELIRAARRRGELRSSRLGPRRVVLLDEDVVAWIHSHSIQPTDADRDFVARRLGHEQT
jgi:predicted DNA-binding transcriptional regulator AlpA